MVSVVMQHLLILMFDQPRRGGDHMAKLLLLLKYAPSLITVAEKLKLLFKGEFSSKKAIFILIVFILGGAAIGTDFLTVQELNDISDVVDEAIELAE